MMESLSRTPVIEPVKPIGSARHGYQDCPPTLTPFPPDQDHQTIPSVSLHMGIRLLKDYRDILLNQPKATQGSL